MASRNGKQQSAHNRGVQATARELERKGWNVRADLPGKEYDEPPLVAGHVPDVYATKRGGTRIVEIETSAGGDSEQHKAFRRSAGQTGAKFTGYVVDRGGRRIEEFS